ncbi:hypothetical protein CHUAL_002072 [Chamberlinius hualienensis]
MSGEAYVTVVTDEDSAIGAVVLAESLHAIAASSKRNLVALISNDNLKPFSRQLLRDVFTHVYSTRDLIGHDDLALSLLGLGRQELANNFAKIHCWRLTQYTKCVYLEADTLVLANCDELFERDELSAVPDVGWPDCFNAGVFVFQPSLRTFARLVSLLTSTNKYNYQGGDQGLLNTYFGDWRNDLTKRLPFVYNVVPSSHYTYTPALHRFSSAIKIVHFYKPWSAPWPIENRGPNDHMDSWTAIFKNKVLPKLPEKVQQLIRSSISGSATEVFRRLDQQSAPPPLPSSPQSESQPYHENQPFQRTYSDHQVAHHSDTTNIPTPHAEDSTVQYSSASSQHEHHDTEDPQHQPFVSEYQSPPELPSSQLSVETVVETPHHELLDPHWEALLWDTIKSPWEPPAPVHIDDYQSFEEEKPVEPEQLTFGWFSKDSGARPYSEPATFVSHEEASPTPHSSYDDEQKTFGSANFNDDVAKETKEVLVDTEEKSAERKKAWEEGNMDYLGKDKFDNIWRRLEQLLRDPSDFDEQEEEETLESSIQEADKSDADTETILEVEVVDSVKDWPGYPEGDLSGMYDWMEGRIDYTGRDKSDNILKRLDMFISGNVPYMPT